MRPSKPRTDSWYAPLPEEERWEVYGKLCRLPWQGVAKWLREEKGLAVSRSGLYRFAAKMRPLESARREAGDRQRPPLGDEALHGPHTGKPALRVHGVTYS